MKFVKISHHGYHTIDYGKVLEMTKSLNREITTVEEYRDWVRDWRKENAALVSSIQYMRTVKNDFKFGLKPTNLDRTTAMNSAHGTKLSLRPYARELNEKRVENKARFKAGEYGDPKLRTAA